MLVARQVYYPEARSSSPAGNFFSVKPERPAEVSTAFKTITSHLRFFLFFVFRLVCKGNIKKDTNLKNSKKSGNQGRKNANPCTRKVYSWIMYGCKGNSMVYLKPRYSRLDRLALRQSSQLSTEAQQEHVKI